MRDELVAEVRLDQEGRLLFKPSQTLFDDLHMAGAWGFRWDAPSGSLAIPVPRQWTYRDWFEHVVKVIGRQYGVRLTLGPDTRWTNVPSAMRNEIEATR